MKAKLFVLTFIIPCLFFSQTQLGVDIDGLFSGNESGRSVAINGIGNIIAIGAPRNANDRGGVFVYEYNGSSWVQLGTTIIGESLGDESAALQGLSINKSGNRVAIGARLNDGNGDSSGHVRIYEYNASAWIQLGSDIDGEAISDQSGSSVSMNNSGNLVVIGARFNNGNGASSGHVRIYEYNGSNWIQLGTDIDGEASSDEFGYSVSVNDSGERAVIGAPLNDGNGNTSGHVRVYILASLSIERNNFSDGFSVYPNPSSGLSKIQLGESYNEVSVNVFNVLGKQVATEEHNNTNEIELNTQELSEGIYFIKVKSGAKEATIKLVVK